MGDALDTDVLIVGAGPTGLMLANQLARRGLTPLIIDRHAGPARETRALGVQARTLEIYEKLGIVDRALELGKRGTGANLWADGKRRGRVPLGDAGRACHAVSVHPDPRPGRQRTHHGREAARARHRGAMEHRAHRHRAARRQGHRDAEAARRFFAHARCRLGRRLRRRAQRRARAQRHRVSGRAVRARVLRRRRRDDRHDGARRSQHLPLARGIPSFLSDARREPLAHRRHRAAGAARSRRAHVRRGRAVDTRRSGRRARIPFVHVVLDVPHPSSRAPRTSATAAASCSAMPRTSTARSARRA